MITAKITLTEMLDSRERRADKQRRLIETFNCALICFTMNIAGEVKRSSLTDFAFRCGESAIINKLGDPLYYEDCSSHTGNESFFVYDNYTASQLKHITESIEDGSPVGRLYDMDVLDAEQNKLSRVSPRSCIVCNGTASVCARNREHGLNAVFDKTNLILLSFASQELARIAVESLIAEVHTTPKPGLVDENNTGSHNDMDVSMFECSANALNDSFVQATMAGLAGQPSFEALRQIGLCAEQAMNSATCGVNTHRGAIYSFVLLLYGYGRALSFGSDPFECVEVMCEGELKRIVYGTNGEDVRLRYGANGAKAEAMRGFPTAREAAKLLANNEPFSVLLWIISQTEDTNVLHRGGVEGLNFLRQECVRIWVMSAEQQKEAALQLDKECIKRRISPGGSADMLAMALFISKADLFVSR